MLLLLDKPKLIARSSGLLCINKSWFFGGFEIIVQFLGLTLLNDINQFHFRCGISLFSFICDNQETGLGH